MDHQTFPRCTPEEQGITSSSIESFLTAIAEQGLELHSFMIVKNGFVVSEGWWKPYAPELIHSMFSVTKTFTATAVGFAVQEGLLTVEDRVADYFPDELPDQPSEKLLRLRIKDLLTMGTGQPEDTFPDATGSWIAGFLGKPVEAEPGTRFAYHNGASNMLSIIVERASGQNLHQFLRTRLFDPLGIAGERWERNPDGTVPGGYGLRLRTEDMAKLGQLYLQKGVWRGERLLSEQWVEEATSKQISNGTAPDSDWEAGYGYQLWRCYRNQAYRFIGMFNQLCLVLPEQQALVVLTSGLSNEAAVLDTIWKHLVPAMREEALPQDDAASSRLAEAIASLNLVPEKLDLADFRSHPSAGTAFELDANQLGWKSVSFEADERLLTIVVEEGQETKRIIVSSGEWTSGEFGDEPTLVNGGIREDGSLRIISFFVTAPFRHMLDIGIDEDRITLTLTINVGLSEPLVISGKRIASVPAQ